MRALPAALATAACLTIPVGVFGQSSQTNVSNTNPDNDRRQVVPFLDATYVGFAVATRFDPDLNKRVTDGTFEADIVPNFVIHQTFFDGLGRLDSEQSMGHARRYGTAWSLVAVPMVRLRMFVHETSSPVRTPSYMPKVTFQTFLFELQDSHANLWALQATGGHHSNGQDGCLYEFQSRPPGDENGDCGPAPPLDRSHVEVNRRDGSFSTNYVLLGLRYRRIGKLKTEQPLVLATARDALEAVSPRMNPEEIRDTAAALAEAAKTVSGKSSVIDEALEQVRSTVGKPDRSKIDEAVTMLLNVTDIVVRQSHADWTLGADLELNPSTLFGGGDIDPELKSRYGATRVTMQAGAARHLGFCHRAELKGFGKYIHHPAAGVPSWAGSVEGQCLFRDTNWGLFARYYTGQDYYNLGFEDHVRRFQGGMTYSQEGFLRFVSKAIREQLTAQPLRSRMAK